MNKRLSIVAAGLIAGIALFPGARAAQADTTSTVAIIAAAAAVVGVILTDSNNQPYYVQNGRHVYVSQNTATYYRSHGNARNRNRAQGPMQMRQWQQQQQNRQRPRIEGRPR